MSIWVPDQLAPIFVVFLQPSHDLHSEVLRRSLESTLTAAVAVMDQMFRDIPGMQRLLEGIENEIRLQRVPHPPTDDHARVNVNDEGDVHRASPSGHERDVRHPQPVRGHSREGALNQVGRSRGVEIRHRCLVALAPYHTADAELSHQALHGAACDPDTFPVELLPDFVSAVGTEVLVPHTNDLDL